MAKDNCENTYKNPDLKKRAIVSLKAKAKKKNGKKKVPAKPPVKKG